jgi:hypothetical protein
MDTAMWRSMRVGGRHGMRSSLTKPSCQVLAQNTHPHMPPEKGRKALLEHLRQGM